MSAAGQELVWIANTRLPSLRAQGLQVVQMAAALARAGGTSARVRVLYAKRRGTPTLPAGQGLLEHYGEDPSLPVAFEALPCIDWIERVPVKLQFVPARLQEWSFARRAAREALRSGPGAVVLTREIESAAFLVKSGHPKVLVEVHRVPGGRIRRRLLDQARRGVVGWVAISGGVAEDLEALGIDRADIMVEHDGYSQARFEGCPSRSAARLELGLSETEPVVVYTGGMMPWKGVDLLLEAVRGLAATVLIVGGTDQDLAPLKQRFSDLGHVRFLGFQEPRRIPLFLAAADVGVVPNRSKPAISARYTSPLKIFEAMAVGLPLVVSDLPSMRDILGPEEAHFVRPDDSQALREGLDALLEDAALRGRLAHALAARAERHTWNARAERILAWVAGR